MTNFFEEDKEISNLIQRYESFANGVENYFFDVSDFVEIIEFYLSKMKENKAQKAIVIALEQYPNATPILYKKVEMLVLKGQSHKALELLNSLAETNNDSEFYLLQGGIFTSLQKIKQADASFQKAIDQETDSENRQDILFRIGLAFQHVLEFSLALKYHYKLYEEDANFLDNLFEIAYCYEQLGRLENSIRFYNKYLDISPYSHKVWYNLGIIYNSLQRYEEAVDAYEYTLAINPNHTKAFFNKGNALFYLERYNEALACYFSYLDTEDNHSFTHTYIAECYEKLSDYPNAILHYEKAIKIDAELPDAWFGLGMVEKLKGNINGAISLLEKVAKLDQTYAECYAELGELYAEINEDTLAINAYRYAIIAEPEVLQYHLELAKFYHKKNNIAEAYKILVAIQNNFKDEAELFYYLSLFAFLLNEKTVAKLYLKKAKIIDDKQFHIIVNYCKKNASLVEKGQIDELLKLD